MQRNISIVTDLAYPMHVIQLPGTFFEGDDNAVNLRVTVNSHGSPYAMTGTVKGYIIRADGVTNETTGAVDASSEAQLPLSAADLSVCGPVQITVKLEAEGGYVTTIACCRCYVHRTVTPTTA